MKYFKGQPFRQNWSLKIWQSRVTVLNKLKCQLSSFIIPEEFHMWFGRKKLSDNYDLTLIKDLMHRQKDSDATYPIVSAFFKGWIDKNVENPDKTKCHPAILKWGAYFLDLHIVTLFLNSIDKKCRNHSAFKNCRNKESVPRLP